MFVNIFFFIILNDINIIFLKDFRTNSEIFFIAIYVIIMIIELTVRALFQIFQFIAKYIQKFTGISLRDTVNSTISIESNSLSKQNRLMGFFVFNFLFWNPMIQNWNIYDPILQMFRKIIC